MSRKTVYWVTCDQCGKEKEVEKKGEVPDGWIERLRIGDAGGLNMEFPNWRLFHSLECLASFIYASAEKLIQVVEVEAKS